MGNGELDNVGVEPGLISYEFTCKTWTNEPQRFRLDPTHRTSGPNIQVAERRVAGLAYRRFRGFSSRATASTCGDHRNWSIGVTEVTV